MKTRFRLFRRASGVFYIEDTKTLRQESLKTKDRTVAQRVLQARNQAHEQPALNLQLARTYLAASDPEVAKRTWQTAMDVIASTKTGPTRDRWLWAVRDEAFDSIRQRRILDTRAEDLIRVLNCGTVSTNVFLRRVHNFTVDMNWLPWPLIPKRQWPAVHHRPKRGITSEEHQRIIERERNPELNAFYRLCWHLGGAQSDIASLRAEDIDWSRRAITYSRRKTKVPVLLHFGDDAASVLRALPTAGPLFPRLAVMHEKHRAKLFHRRCRLLGVSGVSLHSYRYAWAERAKVAGYPERFAMEALGHNSTAVHRAYAKNAQMQLPALEEYEKASRQQKVVPFPSCDAQPQALPT
jgi:integrase